MRWFTIPALASALVLPGCADYEMPRPELQIDLNVRNLGQVLLSDEPTDRRCDRDPDCGPDGGSCVHFPGESWARGFCRQCTTDGNCPLAHGCDHGFCHRRCGETTGCDAGLACVQGWCRRPHLQDLAVCNGGRLGLEIHADRTELRGDDQACAFSRMEWERQGDLLVIEPGDCTALRILVLPAELGEHRGMILIRSSDERMDYLPLFFCALGVEARCEPDAGDECNQGITCELEDFADGWERQPGCAWMDGGGS